MRTRRFLALLAVGLAAGACSSILDLNSYQDGPGDASAGGSAGAGGGSAGADSGTGGAAGAGGTGATGGTGASGGSGGGGTGGSGGAKGCQPIGGVVKIMDANPADLDGNNLALFRDVTRTGGLPPRVFAAVGTASDSLIALGVLYTGAGLSLQNSATVSGVGKPRLGKPDAFGQPPTLAVFTDTSQVETFDFGNKAGYDAGNMTATSPTYKTAKPVCNVLSTMGKPSPYSLMSIAYAFDDGYSAILAATCDDGGGKRYITIDGSAPRISGSSSDPDLLVKGLAVDEFTAKTVLVLGTSANILRIDQFNGNYATPHTLDLSGGDAGSSTSTVLGTWGWHGPFGDGGTALQLGMIGVLSSGASMTLMSGVAGTPADYDTLQTAPLQILTSSTSTAPLSLPGSAVGANDKEAWWAGTDPGHTSVTMLRFAAPTGVPASQPYVVYSVASGGTKTVTQAVAAPFDSAGTGLVMWSQIDGTSAAVYAQAVNCPP